MENPRHIIVGKLFQNDSLSNALVELDKISNTNLVNEIRNDITYTDDGNIVEFGDGFTKYHNILERCNMYLDVSRHLNTGYNTIVYKRKIDRDTWLTLELSKVSHDLFIELLDAYRIDISGLDNV